VIQFASIILFHAALESCPIPSVKKKVQLLMDRLITAAAYPCQCDAATAISTYMVVSIVDNASASSPVLNKSQCVTGQFLLELSVYGACIALHNK